MAWLLRDGEVLASLEVARTRRERSRGLLGRDGIDGALLIQPCKSVHTVGMRFPMDVAFVDREMVVVRIIHMRRHRLSRFVWRARGAIEAEAGCFGHWDLKVGDQLEVKE